MAQGNKTELVQFMDLSDRFTILTNQLIEDLRINRELSPFCRHLRSIQHQHQRNRLKVVFFGRTSKGKSTTINALLGRKVLPSAKGRTTSCFCILKGYDNLRSNGTSSDQDDENIMDEGYFQANNNVKRIPLKELSKKMKALRQSGNEEVKVINVFLPKNKHEILKEEIEIMDTPGGSTDDNIDSSIKDLYADTDVCVYLLNVNDTIEKDDQEFIKKMLMQHHQAEMFILVNYCDELDDCSEDEANEVKNQNLINSQIALNGLNDRVFFVSSKEALAAKVNGLTSEELRDENEKERLRAFETFEREIRERVCISTRKAKLAQSMDKVIEVNGDIREMILQNLLRWSNDLGTNSKINLQDGNNFYLQISQQREKYYEKLSSVSQCLNSSTHRWMESQLKSLEAKIYKDVNTAIQSLCYEVEGMIQTFLQSHPLDFAQEMTQYKRRLGEYLNIKFRVEMEELYQNNFDEIRYQLISNLYARLTEQLKQNDDILQVIQALDFREGLDYGIINCHDYLARFEEDLSLYSTIKKNLLPAEISGLAASAAGFMAKRIATGLISASLSTIGAVGTGVYLGAKHIDPKERGKNFKQQLDKFISNHLKDNITRYVAAIFNQIRILYFSFNGTVESKLIHFRDQFERRWSFLNVVENKILPFNAEIDELRKKF